MVGFNSFKNNLKTLLIATRGFLSLFLQFKFERFFFLSLLFKTSIYNLGFPSLTSPLPPGSTHRRGTRICTPPGRRGPSCSWCRWSGRPPWWPRRPGTTRSRSPPGACRDVISRLSQERFPVKSPIASWSESVRLFCILGARGWDESWEFKLM